MKRLKTKTKILYGLAGVGDSALYNIMGTFALFFLTTVAGVNPAVAGTITAIGSVWDTVCGAVMGYVSDNTESRFGKRKPYLLAASVPLMLFTSLFFFDLEADAGFMTLYYGIIMILFWTSFSMFFVPYLAWGAELTTNYDERTVLRGYVSFFNTAGAVLGLVVPNMLVDFITKSGYSTEAAWQTTGILCGAISGGTILIGAIGIKGKSEYDERNGNINKSIDCRKKNLEAVMETVLGIISNYIQILRLRSVRYILGASVFYLIGYTMFCSDRMYFFTYNIGLSGSMITALMMLMTLIPVIFIPVISFLNRWIDKRTTYMAGMMICAAGFVIFGLIGSESIAGVCILSVVYCIGNGAYWQLMPAMIYDVCEVDQLINLKERSGMVISLQSLSEALSCAVGMQIMGLILSISGFDGEASVQNETALEWIGISLSILPAIFMGLSAFCIFKYPVTKKMYNKVLTGLEKRKKGEDIDMDEFRKLK